MTRLLSEAIQYAIGGGFGMVNLSTGADVSKQRWRPTEIVHRDVELVSTSLRGRAIHSAFSWAAHAIYSVLLPRVHAWRTGASVQHPSAGNGQQSSDFPPASLRGSQPPASIRGSSQPPPSRRTSRFPSE
jgi:hypothetical protein